MFRMLNIVGTSVKVRNLSTEPRNSFTRLLLLNNHQFLINIIGYKTSMFNFFSTQPRSSVAVVRMAASPRPLLVRANTLKTNKAEKCLGWLLVVPILYVSKDCGIFLHTWNVNSVSGGKLDKMK